MSKIIKLTTTNGDSFLVNVDHIISVVRLQGGIQVHDHIYGIVREEDETVVDMDNQQDDEHFTCKETPDQIYDMINNQQDDEYFTCKETPDRIYDMFNNQNTEDKQ